MRSRPNPLFSLVNKDYHEKFDAYDPQRTDFCDLVSRSMPQGWLIQRRGLWFHCGSPDNYVPHQGWKIHVSATPANARDILRRVTCVLLERADTDFKFALDMSTLFLLNSKNWSRGGSGKFITVYPHDNPHFVDLIEQLHRATEGLRGPYILSDHRYKDSNVLFYRYGGMRLREVLNVKGERTPILIAPDGAEVPDHRTAYPIVPPWERSPLPLDDLVVSEEMQGINGGRYQIEEVLAFSNAGGVYRAIDQHTGKQVVIKEARPCVNSTFDGYDAVETLKKEFRLLTALQNTGIAPQPVDLFKEWEHWFLVEEYIPGLSLASHSAENNVLLRTRPQLEQYRKWYQTFRSICFSLANILEVLHSRGIIFADLSLNNLIVPAGEATLKIIDFEGASQIGVDRPSTVFTPGFVSANRLAGVASAFEDDYYSAGAVLLAYLFPVNALFHLKPEAKSEIMSCIQRDARLPGTVAEMILALMNQDPKQRPLPQQIREVTSKATEPGPAVPKYRLIHDYQAVIDGIIGHIDQIASYSRQDRLFPSDPKLFGTNPLSLAYGAAGVGYALARIEGKYRNEILQWILRHKITPETYAPGLYVGMSGIALCLLEMGAVEEAEDIFQLTFAHPLLYEVGDIFYGIAGWGLANLHFFLKTHNQFYLDKAIQAGQKLLETCRLSPHGYSWESFGETRLGFAHGSSGIALFLLYLHCASGDSEFLRAGQRALEFDLSFAVETKDGGLSWRQTAARSSPLFPYWRFGSAGIGSSVLRYYKFCGAEHYGSVLKRICIDAERRYTVFPGRFIGLAGLGDFMLDMHEFTGETRYFEAAEEAADAILLFGVKRPGGIAFPGDMLSRLCCDYGTGSAGIALFFNRLLHGHKADFTLDFLLEHSRPLESQHEMKAELFA